MPRVGFTAAFISLYFPDCLFFLFFVWQKDHFTLLIFRVKSPKLFLINELPDLPLFNLDDETARILDLLNPFQVDN
jgi:hypothetical protein